MILTDNFFCLGLAQSWLINMTQCFSSFFALKGERGSPGPLGPQGEKGAMVRTQWFKRCF